MKLFIILATCTILLFGCGGTAQTPSSTNPPPATSATPKVAISPIPDDVGLIMRCNECMFVEEKGERYIKGQVRNDAKQAIAGYVLAIDLQDAKGKVLRRFLD